MNTIGELGEPIMSLGSHLFAYFLCVGSNLEFSHMESSPFEGLVFGHNTIPELGGKCLDLEIGLSGGKEGA